MPPGKHDQMSETLSALIDNELDELEQRRILKQLDEDSRLRETWSRYHVIGLVMRGGEVTQGPDFAVRVSRQLGDESGANPGKDATASPAPAWLGSASNLAWAASLAAVLLVGGVVLSMQGQSPLQPVNGGGDDRLVFVDEGTRWEGVDPRSEDTLNALLIEHGEFTSASGMNGLTAYAKFVAYDSQ